MFYAIATTSTSHLQCGEGIVTFNARFSAWRRGYMKVTLSNSSHKNPSDPNVFHQQSVCAMARSGQRHGSTSIDTGCIAIPAHTTWMPTHCVPIHIIQSNNLEFRYPWAELLSLLSHRIVHRAHGPAESPGRDCIRD